MKPDSPQMGAVVLAPREQALARPKPTVIDMIQALIDHGVTKDNAEALKTLAELARSEKKDAAERDFASAFVALQADLPVIVAKTSIQNRGKYERFEDLMNVIGPLLTKHGFTVSFSMDFKDGRILETCHLTFGNYTRSNTFAVRTARADSDTQADCKAATTAKRNALCNALNIVIRQDCMTEEEDASLEGDPNAKVTPAQAEELERRVKETNSNVQAFLQLSKAKKFSDIPAGAYDVLDGILRRKEQQGR